MKNFKEIYLAACLTMMTTGIGFICIQVLKIPVIEVKVDMLVPFVEMARDNREQILILKATKSQEKESTSAKNSEVMLNYMLPVGYRGEENKTVDKLTNTDIIRHY